MSDSTVLLSSTAPVVIETLEGVVNSIGKLPFTIVPRLAEPGARVPAGNIPVGLAPLEHDAPDALVGRLLRTIAECGRPTATVVLSDRRQLRQTTALLRQGVADYLSQPFDWDRVAR